MGAGSSTSLVSSSEILSLMTTSRGDPSGFQSAVCKLAQLTGCRCLSVRYRLAPQHPFPTALLDVLVTYLSLLYPPPDSFHEPIPASRVILVGDSAGANLCLALVQFILHLHRQDGSCCTIKFFGRNVALPLPAGLVAFSAWTDCTNSLPSFTSNKEHDYFSADVALDRVVPCDIWPTSPPRGALYCDISALCHPLVSPTIAKDWTGSPPMWFCCGQEMLANSSKVIAQRAASQGCRVRCTEYEAMPHCFPFVFVIPQTEHSFKTCAQFCLTCVDDPSKLESQAIRVDTSIEEHLVDIRNLVALSYDEVKERMRRSMQRMAKRYRKKHRMESKM